MKANDGDGHSDQQALSIWDFYWVVSPYPHVVQCLYRLIYTIKWYLRLATGWLKEKSESSKQGTNHSSWAAEFVVLSEEAYGPPNNQRVAPGEKHRFDKCYNQFPNLVCGSIYQYRYLFLSFFLLKMMKGIRWTSKYILYKDLHVAINWSNIFILHERPGWSCSHFSSWARFKIAFWMNY